MELINTTEISLDNKALALRQFKELTDSKKIIMVIIGKTKKVEEAVEIADETADSSMGGFDRCVLWIKDYKTLKSKLSPILRRSNIIKGKVTYEKIKCFCLTQENKKAHSFVFKNKSLNDLEILHLFTEAEKNSLN